MKTFSGLSAGAALRGLVGFAVLGVAMATSGCSDPNQVPSGPPVKNTGKQIDRLEKLKAAKGDAGTPAK